MYKTLYIALHETNIFPPEDGFGALNGLFFRGENVSFGDCGENNHLVVKTIRKVFPFANDFLGMWPSNSSPPTISIQYL